MPLLSLCSYPGCRHPVPRGEKYCDKHKGAGTRREQLQKKEHPVNIVFLLLTD